MTTKTGIVESVARTGKSIKVDGQWYGAFAKSQIGDAKLGDNVSFAFTSVVKDGNTYNNIKGNVSVSGGGGGSPTSEASAPRSAAPASFGGRSSITFPLAPLDGQRVIVRQNALSHATKVYMDGDYHNVSPSGRTDCELVADDIILLARKFEAYVAGDLDLEEAKKGLD